MQNLQKKYVKPFAICRIVRSPDFAYSAYVCTPDFADDGDRESVTVTVTVEFELRLQVSLTGRAASPGQVAQPASDESLAGSLAG